MIKKILFKIHLQIKISNLINNYKNFLCYKLKLIMEKIKLGKLIYLKIQILS